MAYAKYISNLEIEFAPKNKGSVINYDTNIELLTQDGYKPYIESEKPITNRKYHGEYENNENDITLVYVYDETQAQADARELEEAKETRAIENDEVRDEALYQGVVYKGVLFDSDTDQKVNLLAIVSTMDETDTIVWYGMDNQPLECNKQDLINIGGLITQLHAFCWNRNAEIKSEISEAQTIEALEEIEIDYTLGG